MRTAITGASGLLGRAVRQECSSRGDDILALSNTQTGSGLKPLDLLDERATRTTLTDFKPDVIIHCAAERRPDVAEKDPDGTEKLNVAVPRSLGLLAKELGALLIYVSTDYVFDGNAPPEGYQPEDKPNPINLYGKTKLAGEHSAREANDQTVVLRVPVLYGRAPNNADSAVNVLVDAVKATGKTSNMDDYAIRFPTCVEDVGRVLRDIAERYSGSSSSSLPRLLFFSAQTQYTKYTMGLMFGKILELDDSHLVRQSEAPRDATSRPRDAHLSNAALEKAGISSKEAKSFEEWWRAYLSQ